MVCFAFQPAMAVKLNISEIILVITIVFLLYIASSHIFIRDKLWYSNIFSIKPATSG